MVRIEMNLALIEVIMKSQQYCIRCGYSYCGCWRWEISPVKGVDLNLLVQHGSRLVVLIVDVRYRHVMLLISITIWRQTRMIETCVCCGHRGETSETSDWTRVNARRPDIFICDVCRVELVKWVNVLIARTVQLVYVCKKSMDLVKQYCRNTAIAICSVPGTRKTNRVPCRSQGSFVSRLPVHPAWLFIDNLRKIEMQS